MKLVKMSLVAAMVMGASAFAIDNVKVSGDAKVFYNTNNLGTASLFDKDSSMADTALRLGVTGDLLKGVSFGVTANAISTLGLENNLVSNVWEGNGKDQSVMSELWMAATLGKTTAKIGRMELDTPLAFSEKWSVLTNTFDAAVLINQDLPDTTLVGAWVGKSNGSATTGNAYVVMAPDLGFTSFYQGAYAAAIVNNSFKPLTAQAWYYDVQHIANAYWLQADWECQLIKNVKVGVQYADIDLKNSSADSSAYAVKVAYDGIKNLKVSAAYSDADNDGALNVANIATTNSTSQSKLYTEAWWNYGYVGAAGAESMNVTAEYDAGFAKVGAYFTDVNNDIATSIHEVTEVTLTASKSFGPLDATVAYMSIDADDQNNGSRYDMLHAYLTLNF
jgi:hypothetical protein